MNHPYELLVGLVDGTLDEGDLAGVHAHLDMCASCREDVAHATAGREAARSLPQMTAPTDLHQRVLAAAGGRGHGTPGWYRWAGVAAAAAVVVAIVIALPNVGDGTNEDAPGDVAALEAGAKAEGARSIADVAITIEHTNYDEKGLQRLVSASLDAASSAQTAPTGAADPVGAVRCVRRAVENKATGQLIRLIQARFEGRAAYIAVYSESPGAGQQPDLLTAWVAARDDCSFLSLAFSQI